MSNLLVLRSKVNDLILSDNSRYYAFQDYQTYDNSDGRYNRPTNSFSLHISFRTSDTTHIKYLFGGRNTVLGKYYLRIDADGKMFGRLVDDDTNGGDFTADSTIYSDNAWHQVTFVIDRENDVAKIYVDGSETGTKDISSFTNLTTPQDLLAGAFNTTGGLDDDTFEGYLENFRYYTKALSVAQVQSLNSMLGAAKEVLPTVTNLELWFRSDARLLTASWDDLSGNNRDLTLNNTPTIVSGAINGWDALRLDGVNQGADLLAFTLNGNTIYIAMKHITYTDFDYFYDGAVANKNALRQSNSTPIINYNTGNSVDMTPNLGLGTWGIMSTLNPSSNGKLRVQLNLNATNISSGNSSNDCNGFILGSRATPSNYANFDVAEVLVYSSEHNQTTIDSVVTYLMNRYNI